MEHAVSMQLTEIKPGCPSIVITTWVFGTLIPTEKHELWLQFSNGQTWQDIWLNQPKPKTPCHIGALKVSWLLPCLYKKGFQGLCVTTLQCLGVCVCLCGSVGTLHIVSIYFKKPDFLATKEVKTALHNHDCALCRPVMQLTAGIANSCVYMFTMLCTALLLLHCRPSSWLDIDSIKLW